MLDLIVLHGEFSLFTVRGNFWYQIYRNRRKKVLCSRLSLITLTITPPLHRARAFPPASCRELSRLALSGEGIIVLYIHKGLIVMLIGENSVFPQFASSTKETSS